MLVERGDARGAVAEAGIAMDSRTSDSIVLVAAAQSGDREAFARLYQRYARMVHGILLARVPASDAEDLVQDVFLRALEKVGQLRNPGAFGAWLGTLARNRARDFLRRRRSAASLDEEPAGADRPTLEAREALAAIRDLPERPRELLIWRLVEGMTGPEIADRTGASQGTVRVQLHRAMAALRKKLATEKLS